MLLRANITIKFLLRHLSVGAAAAAKTTLFQGFIFPTNEVQILKLTTRSKENEQQAQAQGFSRVERGGNEGLETFGNYSKLLKLFFSSNITTYLM